ncbi:MAG: hypothetical protein WCC97_14375 [Candidatus Acidiferrales bacterium]
MTIPLWLAAVILLCVLVGLVTWVNLTPMVTPPEARRTWHRRNAREIGR